MRASRRMKAEMQQRGPSWFETALARLLTMRVEKSIRLLGVGFFAGLDQIEALFDLAEQGR